MGQKLSFHKLYFWHWKHTDLAIWGIWNCSKAICPRICCEEWHMAISIRFEHARVKVWSLCRKCGWWTYFCFWWMPSNVEDETIFTISKSIETLGTWIYNNILHQRDMCYKDGQIYLFIIPYLCFSDKILAFAACPQPLHIRG